MRTGTNDNLTITCFIVNPRNTIIHYHVHIWEGVVGKTAHDVNSKCRILSACRVYLEKVAHKRQCFFAQFGTNNLYLENWYFCANRHSTTTTDGYDRLHYSLHTINAGVANCKTYVFTSEHLKYQISSHFSVCMYRRNTIRNGKFHDP